MSEPTPFGGGPLDDLMRNLARLLVSAGPVNWEIARQMATFGATGGQPEDNPDPVARVRLDELLRVADLNMSETTGLATAHGGVLRVRAVTRNEWAQRTLDAWKPQLERLASALSESGGPATPLPGEPEAGAPGDPMSQLLGNLPQVIGPLLFGMQTGSMVGDLARRAMGEYDLPMPRPPSDELLLVPTAIDAFGRDWSLPEDDVRLWVLLREVSSHAVFGRPHVRRRLEELMDAYGRAFHPDTRAFEERLTTFDPTDTEALQATFGDTEALLGELQSDEQRSLQVPLQSLLTVIAGYVDHVMDSIGHRLIGSYVPLTEALRRRRLEDGQGQRILAKLLGVGLDEAAYARGRSFVHGVLERAGEEGLGRLWRSDHELPTPAEVDAPGLWLARIDLPS